MPPPGLSRKNYLSFRLRTGTSRFCNEPPANTDPSAAPMSLSDLCIEQHERERSRLRKILATAVLGSVGIHAIVFGLSRSGLWQHSAEAELIPIELIVTEPLTEASEVEPEPIEPADLGAATSDFAAGAAIAAPARAAIVAAPVPSAAEVSRSSAAAEPEPEPEPAADSVAPSELTPDSLPEDLAEEPEAPPEITDTEDTAEPSVSEDLPLVEALADSAETAAAPDSSQFERLRDLLRRQPVSATSQNNTPIGDSPSATAATGPTPRPEASGGRSASPAEGEGETAARSAPTAAAGGGGGGGSRTVACQSCVEPEYPQSALEAGVEGRPRVSVQINPDGSVASVTLIRPSGNTAIDQAAIRAAQQSRFQPVAGGASFPIEYNLSIEGSQQNRDAQRRRDRRSTEVAAPDPPERPAQTAAEPAAQPAPTASDLPAEETEAADRDDGEKPPVAPVVPDDSTPAPTLDSAPASDSGTAAESEPAPPAAEPAIEPSPPLAVPKPAAPAAPDPVEPPPEPESTDTEVNL